MGRQLADNSILNSYKILACTELLRRIGGRIIDTVIPHRPIWSTVKSQTSHSMNTLHRDKRKKEERKIIKIYEIKHGKLSLVLRLLPKEADSGGTLSTGRYSEFGLDPGSGWRGIVDLGCQCVVL